MIDAVPARSRVVVPALAAVITLAFLWLIAPFWGAILWAVIAAILFDPLNGRLLRAMPGRRNTAALVTSAVIVAVVVVPAMLLAAALLGEAAAVYARLQGGQGDPGRAFVAAQAGLPHWVRRWLVDIGLGDVTGLRATITDWFATSYQSVAARIVGVGQGTLGFFLATGVMLYLTFFLLRDGKPLVARIERALPLASAHRTILFAQFVTVVRATIKGSLIVAILQGATGGIVCWAIGLPGALLWGVAMGVFSLFPAIGTGLVWVPLALYLLISGSLWQGVVLAAAGFFVISSVDNIVRPILVGRDARMPDYVVLIATLGGFELLGFNGFVVGPVIAALFMAIWGIVSPADAQAA